MQKEAQVASLKGGELQLLDSGNASREVTLALSLNRLLVKMVRVGAGEDPVAVSTPVLQAINPFPDEALTISCETVFEGEGGAKVVLAAALPESSADDIAEKLDAAKLNVTRVDAELIGLLRGIWPSLGEIGNKRRLIVVADEECVSAIVLDGDRPVAIRAIDGGAVLKREILLLLLEAEDFGGVRNLDEVVLLGEADVETLGTFAPVRRMEVGEKAALVGVAARSEEAGTLNALPGSWAEVLAETRFKAKLIKNLSIAGGIWALIMAVLLGVPVAYGFMADHQKTLSRGHSRQYQQVKAMRDKVRLVQKYSDHSRGALEIMKAVSDRLPAGITLTSWNFRRDEGLRIAGESETADEAYEFKNAMEALSFGEGDEGEKVFATVKLGALNAAKGGKQRFDLELGYKGEEEGE